MSRRSTITLAVALGLSLSLVARAHAKPSIAILGLEIIDDGGGVDKDATKFAADLTNGLRHRAMLGKGAYQLAPNSNKDLLELKLLSDCADEGRKCMAEIGREMNAETLMYGKVEKRDDGYQVSLKLLNVETGAMERTLSDIVPFDDGDADQVKEWARTLYNRLTGVPDSGSVTVRANANKGTVYIDGEVRTTLSAGSATISGLSEGSHSLAIESKSYVRYEGTVTVTPGESTDVSVQLERSGGPIETGERPGKTARILFWSSVVATGASVAVFTITGLQVRSLQDDKQTHFEIIIANGANTDGHPTDSNNDFTDVCAIADDNLGVTGVQDLIDTCDDGRSKALLTNIFIGTSVVTALAASYFYYKGYVQPKASEERPTVTVTPALGRGMVGAGIEIQF